MRKSSKVVVVSGLSGSGKSVALNSLEDSGFYAVDNLPATLIPALVDALDRAPNTGHKLAISIDARSVDTISAVPHILEGLRNRGVDCRILYLDATDEAITRRFAESRRPHPLADKVSGGIGRCIEEERKVLGEIAELAHRMDTSEVNANVLRGWVRDWLSVDKTRLVLAFQSFGFKHGIPIDADFVFDVRVLPNPFYDPKLRPLSGMDEAVKSFLDADLNVARMVEDIAGFLLRWLPSFSNESRASVTVAIGCTGGQHRSVYVAEKLAKRLGPVEQSLVRHRDVKM
jgi:RNase adapter protein RapZ